MRSRSLRLVLALLVAGCGPERATEAGARRDGIVGGQPAPADVQVFQLEIDADGRSTSCSATLIGRRSLLTAAHCVDPVSLGARTVTVRATNALDGAGPLLEISETRVHPLWMPAIGLEHDLALLRLAAPRAEPPRLVNLAPLTGLGGAPIRAVGYGTDLTDGGMGTRRSVDLTLRKLSATHLDLGDLTSRGVCHGDSGGPTFHTFADGERLIGVHSFTRTDACTDGADIRVDPEADFILSWLAEQEDACEPDNVCMPGCPTVDPDCRAPGAPCDTAYQCPGRECRTDAQHPAPYCTATCSAGCPPPLSCDPVRGLCQLPQQPTARPGEPCTSGQTFCLDGALCSGARAEAPVCSLRCTVSADCPTGQGCTIGFTGEQVCLVRPLTLPRAEVVEPAAARGCQAVDGLQLAVVLALLRRRAEGAARTRRNC
ncbi:MAG: trypsin-like serine protease [Myxococcota bacterium]